MDIDATVAAVSLERRTITGHVVPWDEYRAVSTGQTVAFAPGSLTWAQAPALTDGHDDTAGIGAMRSAVNGRSRLLATFAVDDTDAGDQALLRVSDALAAGRQPGLSIGADVTTADDTPNGLYVTGAELRHVALLDTPAYPSALVTHVAAQAPEPEDPEDPEEPDMPDTDTIENEAPVSAGAALAERGAPTELAVAPRVAARVLAEPLPYFGPESPGFCHDIVMAAEGDRDAADRFARFNAMLREPRFVRAQAGRVADVEARLLARVEAAVDTTVTTPQLIPPGYRPDLFVDLIPYEAPVWASITKMAVENFNPFNIPRSSTRTGLSGTPTDEVTPVAPGDINFALDTVTPTQVMGSYQFSRALAMGANPAIDAIALNALNESYLADVEARAIAFYTAAGHFTAATYAATTGQGFIKAMRQQIAGFRVRRRATATSIIAPGAVEWTAAIDADDTAGRPLLGWGQNYLNAVGQMTDAADSANILGVLTLPDGISPIAANHTLMLRREDAVAFTTPIMNFRFEANAVNPMVITLVKYSGVAFWARRVEGIVYITNTGGPVIPLEAGSGSGKGK